MALNGKAQRVFKTAWFSQAAKKAHIPDGDLCAAVRQVMHGQGDDLGGGVFKKRLGKNLYRSIILAKGRDNWIFEYLFAKKDRANIAEDELIGFRKLAKAYALLNDEQIRRLVQNQAWKEICNEEEI